MLKTISIAIADDHLITNQAMMKVLNEEEDLNVVFYSLNGMELLKKLKTQPVDIVILDLEMPVMDGREALRLLNTYHPSISTIILSFHHSEFHVKKYLKKGAKAYLSKQCSIETLLTAIREVHRNGFFMKQVDSMRMPPESIEQDKMNAKLALEDQLSDREKEIIRLVCQEMTSAKIADALNISRRTVENHKMRISKKIGTKTSLGILIFAIRAGIFSVTPD